MSTLHYKLRHVNAFTAKRFGGNPAGVVPEAAGLDPETMQAIAREMNLSETAFVLPATVRGADLQIRWFTPTSEVPLCGHATIASFHVLSEEGMHGMRRSGMYRFRVQTRSGVLRVVVDRQFSGTVIEFQLPFPKFKVLSKLSPLLLKAIGAQKRDLDLRLPIVKESYLYLPVEKRYRLWSMVPDMAALEEACRKLKVLGVCVLTLDTVESSSAVHSRFFAPSVGVPEDPVTGSANGPLGIYLHQFAMHRGIPLPSLWLPDGRIEYIGEQGDVMKRSGRVKIRLEAGPRKLKSVAIAGEAVTLMKSDLILQS
jgi:trans-2,3-dihydro-3-hydroxyanthranilate isomerase